MLPDLKDLPLELPTPSDTSSMRYDDFIQEGQSSTIKRRSHRRTSPTFKGYDSDGTHSDSDLPLTDEQAQKAGTKEKYRQLYKQKKDEADNEAETLARMLEDMKAMNEKYEEEKRLRESTEKEKYTLIAKLDQIKEWSQSMIPTESYDSGAQEIREADAKREKVGSLAELLSRREVMMAQDVLESTKTENPETDIIDPEETEGDGPDIQGEAKKHGGAVGGSLTAIQDVKKEKKKKPSRILGAEWGPAAEKLKQLDFNGAKGLYSLETGSSKTEFTEADTEKALTKYVRKRKAELLRAWNRVDLIRRTTKGEVQDYVHTDSQGKDQYEELFEEFDVQQAELQTVYKRIKDRANYVNTKFNYLDRVMHEKEEIEIDEGDDYDAQMMNHQERVDNVMSKKGPGNSKAVQSLEALTQWMSQVQDSKEEDEYEFHEQEAARTRVSNVFDRSERDIDRDCMNAEMEQYKITNKFDMMFAQLQKAKTDYQQECEKTAELEGKLQDPGSWPSGSRRHMETLVDVLKKQLTKRDEQLRAIHDEITENRHQMKVFEAQKSQYRNQIEAFEEDNKNLRAELESKTKSFTSTIEGLEEEVKLLKESTDSMSREINELTATNKQQETDLTDARNTIERTSLLVEQLNTELEIVAADANAVHEDLDKTILQRQETKASLDAKEKELEDTNLSKFLLERKMNKLIPDLEHVQKENSELQRQWQVTTFALQTMRGKLRDARKNIKKKDQMVKIAEERAKEKEESERSSSATTGSRPGTVANKERGVQVDLLPAEQPAAPAVQTEETGTQWSPEEAAGQQAVEWASSERGSRPSSIVPGDELSRPQTTKTAASAKNESSQKSEGATDGDAQEGEGAEDGEKSGAESTKPGSSEANRTATTESKPGTAEPGQHEGDEKGQDGSERLDTPGSRAAPSRGTAKESVTYEFESEAPTSRGGDGLTTRGTEFGSGNDGLDHDGVDVDNDDDLSDSDLEEEAVEHVPNIDGALMRLEARIEELSTSLTELREDTDQKEIERVKEKKEVFEGIKKVATENDFELTEDELQVLLAISLKRKNTSEEEEEKHVESMKRFLRVLHHRHLDVEERGTIMGFINDRKEFEAKLNETSDNLLKFMDEKLDRHRETVEQEERQEEAMKQADEEARLLEEQRRQEELDNLHKHIEDLNAEKEELANRAPEGIAHYGYNEKHVLLPSMPSNAPPFVGRVRRPIVAADIMPDLDNTYRTIEETIEMEKEKRKKFVRSNPKPPPNQNPDQVGSGNTLKQPTFGKRVDRSPGRGDRAPQKPARSRPTSSNNPDDNIKSPPSTQSGSAGRGRGGRKLSMLQAANTVKGRLGKKERPSNVQQEKPSFSLGAMGVSANPAPPKNPTQSLFAVAQTLGL